jgi:Protein of unknown function (DUF1579)
MSVVHDPERPGVSAIRQQGKDVSVGAENVPRPILVGPEMADLARFFFDTIWMGTVVEGGMGPGMPAMAARGSGRHRTIQDGRWIVGDYEQDQFASDGRFLLTWELHWVTGWDPVAGEYRATLADNYGHADVMRGHIEGDRLIFETLGDTQVRLRLVWDLTDPDDARWRNEMSIAGGAWSLVEEYHLTPVPEQVEIRSRTTDAHPERFFST